MLWKTSYLLASTVEERALVPASAVENGLPFGRSSGKMCYHPAGAVGETVIVPAGAMEGNILVPAGAMEQKVVVPAGTMEK